jgi:hypothetical protein
LIPKKNWLVMIWGLMVAKTMTKHVERKNNNALALIFE